MYKLKLFLLPLAWLLAFMAFACAPPDDNDDNGAPSSGPTINNAIYDVGTAILTVQGTDLSPTTATQAQIQTIRVGSRTNGVAFSSYTADDDATGVNSNGLEPGKYRIKSDGTALWLRLTDRHKAVLEAKTGMDSDSLKKGLLSVSSGAWAGLDTAKDLTVNILGKPSKQTEAEQDEQAEEQSPKQPEDEQAEEDEQVEQVEDQSPEAAITGATYHVGTALLTVQGSNLSPTTATQAQIQTITVDGLALSSYTADSTATGPDSRSLTKGKYRIKSDGTALWLYLTDPHKATLNGKDGMDSNGLKDGLLSVSSGAWAGLNTAKGLAVSGNPAPTITSATYDVNISVLRTGVLVITGTNLPAAIANWDLTKLTIVSGDGSKRFTLPQYSNTAASSSASATSLTIILRDSVKAKAEKILVNDGDSDANGAYNLEAAAGFVIGSSAADTSNPITVRGYTANITSAQYNANTGVLYIKGVKLPTTVAGWDFSKLTLVSGDGKKRFTLPQHATAGENTATGTGADTEYLSITLSGTVKAEAKKILVNDGDSDANGAYNLEAAAGFAGGSAEDTSNNPITVSGHTSQLDYALYTTYTDQLIITGSRLPTAVADWDFSKLTIVSGDGSKRFTLPRHSTTGANKATGSGASTTNLNITLSGSVKAKVEAILVKEGLRDNDGAYNLEAAAGFVPGSEADPTNRIKVVNYK